MDEDAHYIHYINKIQHVSKTSAKGLIKTDNGERAMLFVFENIL